MKSGVGHGTGEQYLSYSERVVMREPYAVEYLNQIMPGIIKSRESLIDAACSARPAEKAPVRF